MTNHTPTRTDEIKAIHREYKFFYQVLGGSLLVAIGILIGAIAFSSDLDRSAYSINLYTSLLSILVTVFVIDFLNRRRDEHRELRQLQQQLIRDAGSTSNEIAKNAIHQLRKRGWLEGTDGLLVGSALNSANLEKANLRRANLQRADLHYVNLKEAILFSSNLKEANMIYSNLQSVELFGSNLEGADLAYANLQGVSLRSTSLQGASLWKANLQSANLAHSNLKAANLLDADLQKANLHEVILDETTILPDGSRWTPDTDLLRFTDPNHTQFWRSNDELSPAYRESETPT